MNQPRNLDLTKAGNGTICKMILAKNMAPVNRKLSPKLSQNRKSSS